MTTSALRCGTSDTGCLIVDSWQGESGVQSHDLGRRRFNSHHAPKQTTCFVDPFNIQVVVFGHCRHHRPLPVRGNPRRGGLSTVINGRESAAEAQQPIYALGSEWSQFSQPASSVWIFEIGHVAEESRRFETDFPSCLAEMTSFRICPCRKRMPVAGEPRKGFRHV